AGLGPAVSDEALGLIAGLANGDARAALNVLELAVVLSTADAGGRRVVTETTVREAAQQRALLYDKSGEEHYNLISALHKPLRGSDPDAALYWLARMLESGEDPLYVARRLVRFASEDVGNADPAALTLALAAKDAYHFLGSPEGELALAQAALYLAVAPKSNAVYTAFGEAQQALRVGVIFGGRSGEHEVSLASAASVMRALAEAGHQVVPVGIARDGRWLTGGDPLGTLAAEARVTLPAADATGSVKKALVERAG